MPLSFSNTSNAATTALNSFSPGLSSSALANAKAKGIGSNISIDPSGQVTALKSPATTANTSSTAVSAAPSTAPGSYKGVAIKPGTDQEIQTQIATINAGGNQNIPPPPPPPTSGLINPQINASGQQTQTAPAQTGPSYSGLVGNLATLGQNGSEAYNQANKALTDFRQNEAEFNGQIYSAPTSAKVMQGRAQAVQAVNAQRENALASGVTNALQGQQQQISALGAAASAAKPTPAAYGQTTFNPLTGQYEGGSAGLDPQTNASTLADAVLGGRMSYSDAAASLGYAGGAGTQFLNNAIMQKNPQANINQLQGQSAATQANTQLQGTTQTQAASQGFTQAIQQYQGMNTSYQAADAQAKTVQQVLDQTGINSANSTDFNKALNTLKGRFSSTNYAQLSTSLAELQNMYTNLLSLSGGTPSGQEAQALNVLNPNSSAQAIKASIAQLQGAAYNKLSSLYQQAQTYQGALQGGGTSGTSQSAGGTSVSGFGWNG